VAAAGAEEAQEHVDELDHHEEAMVVEQVTVDTQEDDDRAEDEIGESMTDRTELDEVTRRQEGGEQTLPVTETTTAGVHGSELDEMPETVAVERVQVELPDYEEGVGENDELISLVQQLAELEEAVGDARMVKSRDEEDMSVLEVAHHSFCFSPPKRDRKLSDEVQQEAKRPKSPAKEDVQQAEQHGSGGECGEEMETDMRERLYPEVGLGFEQLDAMQQEYNDQYGSGLDSARRQQHFK
jgi:hypothetical protein